MARNKQLINIHAKRFISAVFEKRLRDEGFVCPDDKFLCWYRVKNTEVMDSIIFCSNWPNMPLFMDILYETIPLFTKPIHITNVHYNASFDSRWDCYKRLPIREGTSLESPNLAPYDEKTWVYAPKHGGKGLYTLTEVVLPELEGIATIDDCYLMHKKVHLGIDPKHKDMMFFNASREYIDEAIYVNDTEVYPFCRDRIMRALKMYRKLVMDKPNKKELQDTLQYWERLKIALFDDGREEYVAMLNRLKTESIKNLKKKYMLSLD